MGESCHFIDETLRRFCCGRSAVERCTLLPDDDITSERLTRTHLEVADKLFGTFGAGFLNRAIRRIRTFNIQSNCALAGEQCVAVIFHIADSYRFDEVSAPSLR